MYNCSTVFEVRYHPSSQVPSILPQKTTPGDLRKANLNANGRIFLRGTLDTTPPGPVRLPDGTKKWITRGRYRYAFSPIHNIISPGVHTQSSFGHRASRRTTLNRGRAVPMENAKYSSRRTKCASSLYRVLDPQNIPDIYCRVPKMLRLLVGSADFIRIVQNAQAARRHCTLSCAYPRVPGITEPDAVPRSIIPCSVWYVL